jgi:hypothetical protein
MHISLLATALVLVGATPAAGKIPAAGKTPSRRYVAVTALPLANGEACPLPKGDAPSVGPKKTDKSDPPGKFWIVEPAFTHMGRLISKDIPLPPAMRRFCIYSSRTPSASPPSFAPGVIARIDADYDVMLPQGPAAQPPGSGDFPSPGGNLPVPVDSDLPTPANIQNAENAVNAASAALFAEMVGVTPKGIGAQSVYAKTTQHRDQAYLAIIDTTSGGSDYTAAKFERHGLAMAAIANRVRCPAGEDRCLARTMFAQAYPYTGNKRAASPSAAQLGGMMSLSRAIWGVLDAWRTSRVVDSPKAPLILNLSLGWDPALYGTLPDDVLDNRKSHLLLLDEGDVGAGLRPTVPAQVQAIHAALVYANCLDVLTLAAAGNQQVDGCGEQGPLNPAQWERLPAPSRAQCETLFASEWLEAPLGVTKGGGKRSLVYAVGGASVGANFYGGDMGMGPNVLAIARTGSTPPRLVAASHATARVHNQWTEAWSGTSVATAAYAGLAAALWTQRPTLSPHDLVRKIDAGGDSMGKADFPSSTLYAKMLNGHDAYNGICTPAPAERECDPNPYKKRNGDWRSALFTKYKDAIAVLLGFIQKQPTGPIKLVSKPIKLTCGRTLTHYYPSGKESTPPTAPPLPWVRPQPRRRSARSARSRATS